LLYGAVRRTSAFDVHAVEADPCTWLLVPPHLFIKKLLDLCWYGKISFKKVSRNNQIDLECEAHLRTIARIGPWRQRGTTLALTAAPGNPAELASEAVATDPRQQKTQTLQTAKNTDRPAS